MSRQPVKHFASHIIRAARSVFQRKLRDHPDIACEYERLGTDYGGWNFIPRLEPHSVVYSFGVGEDASFDLALIHRVGVSIHAFDPTPRSIEWVKKQDFPPQFIMHHYGLADYDGQALFHPPQNPDHISHTVLDRPSTKAQAIAVPVKRLATIMKELVHDHIDLLKMDIEGAEYAVITDLVQSNIRPTQLLVEFHHRFSGVGTRKTEEAIRQLRSIGYQLFSISETNEEFSFVIGQP